MFKIYYIIILFALSGCVPALFTATTTSTFVAAKDAPVSSTLSDAAISAAIKAGFLTNNFKSLYTKIHVNVDQGRVLLTGTVDKDIDAVTAVKLVWENAYVREVINELVVDKNSNYFNLLQYTRDCMITSQVKTKLFFRTNLKSVNYTIVTVSDVVYVFGISRSEEELEEVTSTIARIHGVNKVVSHAQIIDHDKKDKSD